MPSPRDHPPLWEDLHKGPSISAVSTVGEFIYDDGRIAVR